MIDSVEDGGAGPDPSPPPPRPPRPLSVTVASWLQLVAAGLLVVLVGLMIWHAVDWNTKIDQTVRLVPEADPDEVRGERTWNVVGTVLPGAFGLILAAWIAGTAPGVRRGKPLARTLFLVAAGFQALLYCGPLLGGAVLTVFFVGFVFGFGEPWEESPEGVAGDPSVDDQVWAESRFAEVLYSSPDPLGAVLGPLLALVLLLVAVLTVAVVLLLTVPPAGRFFGTTRTPAPPVAHPVRPGYPFPGSGLPHHPGSGFTHHSRPGPGPVVPPGYLICPDPTLHLPAPPHGPPEEPGEATPRT
ncbi:hypothetical protein [Micromonospora sp. SH-82]|uniref:hypothetical protein n=1 Tax=Micromonospora sp. SH-82 TaxID=3132938 RepID=UPI003EBCB2A4